MVEKFGSPNEPKTPSLEELKNQLRDNIRKTVIKMGELVPKAIKAKQDAWGKVQEGINQGLEGEEFRGDFISRPNDKAKIVLDELNEKVREEVWAHGIASNLPTQDPEFPIKALVNILATGVVQGFSAPLKGSMPVFVDAPFILLSNRGEQLLGDKGGTTKLTSLRTVVVNGEYEAVVEDLRKAFPWVSFRTAEQIDNSMFDKKDPPYKSYEDRIDEEAKKQL